MSILSNIVGVVNPFLGQALEKKDSINKTQNSFGINANVFNPTGKVSGINQAYQNIGRTDSAIQNGLYGAQGGYTGDSGNDPYAQAAAPTDPYAQWGGLANYQALVNQYAGKKSSLLDSINQRVNQEGQTYGRGVEDFLTGAQRTLTGINQKAAQNELARSQGRADILGKVSRGIKSGNVMLGQKNASNSSAAAAIANAYGDIGNRDNMKVEQGYQLNNENINTDLNNFTQDTQRTARRIEEDKNNIINTIVNDATSQLQALDAQIAGASLPDRIAIEQEKNRIRSEASGRLSAYDAQLNQARGLQGMTLEQRRAEAQRLASLGTSAGNPFQIAPEANMQAQTQTNDFGLPIYTMPKRRV